MAKALEKVGVSFDNDGKMSVDETKLKKAGPKDLRAAFYGSYSYSSQIASNAAAISSAAARNSGTYGSDGSLSNYMNFSYEQWT
jgi:flagellar capping protein FliD